MTTLPSLYISHGSPMTALQPGTVGERLAALAAELPRPRAVAIASAHWLTRAPAVGAAALPETVHDFHGFPAALHAIQYPARGAPELAQDIHDLLADAGIDAATAPAQGLDHGMWVPLRLLYPDADVPMVPLAIQPERDPAHHYAVGRSLAALRERGVLVIGSGSITHNLRDLRGGYDAQHPAPYVRPFTSWIERTLAAGDVTALLDYRRQAPHAERAHPTDEHLLPLFVALGAAGDGAKARRIDAGVDHGVLAMDIYRFGD